MDSHELQTTSKTRDIIINSNSPFSPYMLPRDSYPGPKHLDDMDFNQKYAVRAASAPLTPEELGLVRGHLGDIFHEEACASLRCHPTFRTGWARNLEMAPAPQDQDSDATRWFPDICDYANKQTAVYFVGGGPRPDSAGHRHGYTDRRLGCYIYRAWHALHGGRPNLQRRHFFAKALRVPASESAGWSVPGVVAAHRRLCDATAARLGSEVVRLRCEDAASGAFPGTARTWCEHGLSLRHLFRAVVLVADEHVLPVECPEVAAWLERLMPECRVLMVRTGDDAHLSRPVSFERLVREGKTIPLGLEEGRLAEELGVVRVKIGVAMRFLFDLQAEEEAAIPSLRRVSAVLTEERERACHAWVESVLRHAALGDVGVDGNRFTWEAVRRMWAGRDGDIFDRAAQDETRLMPLYSWYGLR
ncbi:hypothetical protein F4781DRAFT_442209 [Annulohypoxylon bovei var. microspora]|nr:hypothetical protein F4781DRAFT_442209 [Annulohypoxylon bovei var. microspora]